ALDFLSSSATSPTVSPASPSATPDQSKSPTPSPTASPNSPSGGRKQPKSSTPGPIAVPAGSRTFDGKTQFDPKLWSGMQWREVGPFRGGRAIAIEGVSGEPNTYY